MIVGITGRRRRRQQCLKTCLRRGRIEVVPLGVKVRQEIGGRGCPSGAPVGQRREEDDENCQGYSAGFEHGLIRKAVAPELSSALRYPAPTE
jgi:hypothetical protein